MRFIYFKILFTFLLYLRLTIWDTHGTWHRHAHLQPHAIDWLIGFNTSL